MLDISVAGTLKVDGYIQANSRDISGNRPGASGGSGGSIYIVTGNFTGRKYSNKLCPFTTSSVKFALKQDFFIYIMQYCW